MNGYCAIIDWKGKKYKIINKYNRTLKQYSKILCPPGTESHFNNLLTKFRGKGYFIPALPGEKLDRDTIEKYLPEIRAKIDWIKAQKKNLKKQRDLLEIKKDISDIRLLINVLLKYKQQYYESQNKHNRQNIKNNSSGFYSEFQKKIKHFVTKIPFLLGFNFPVDHFELRKEYDNYRGRTDYPGKKRANEIYFLRKILEDGAANKDHDKNDIFFRTTLNTLYINLDKKTDIITEEIRYDTEYILDMTEKYLKMGTKKLMERLNEWEGRVLLQLGFYQDLLKNEIKQNNGNIKTDGIIRLQSKAKFNLKNYVLSKYIDAYQFWTEKPKLIRALFALETILINEVGAIDGRDAQERRDIIQVVINRLMLDEYSTLSQNDPLYKNLFMVLEKKVNYYKWLNILFKEGEFSFTYFYMPGSVRVFCPGMARTSRYLRKENLQMSLDLLKDPNMDFKGLRYFSRASMLGRIDMTTLWKKYELIPERPGKRVNKIRHLQRNIKKGNFSFLYMLEDRFANLYKVVEIEDRNYVIPINKLLFYRHRSPHNFKYFRKIK
ncbi:MAG: hypothetical protein KAQ98_11010 [Bacteriovoracaceae bacterium]|nr:hypothetical protein [Bacteriovoracaceae bacterium]